ncbi:hypothetical protein ACFTAO_00730 [Paenibacillus rhizoplanae]
MPDPLSPKAASAAGFNHFIQQSSGPVYALSCLLLEKGGPAPSKQPPPPSRHSIHCG